MPKRKSNESASKKGKDEDLSDSATIKGKRKINKSKDSTPKRTKLTELQITKEIDKSVKIFKEIMPIKSLTLSSLRIGYPCQNWSLNLSTNHVFRMNSFSENKLKETVKQNISDLVKMLEYNAKNGLKFLRIGSQFVPFASHPKFKDQFNWVSYFSEDLKKVGKFVKENNMRISMHPDQFVLINSPKTEIQERSVAELLYHCKLLDTMGLDCTHKVQLHVGGVYDDKVASSQRFVDRYHALDEAIKKRLVIENDDRLYSLKDCMVIHQKTKVPILFDNLHHECLHNGESVRQAITMAHSTWDKEKDGPPLMDYSSQEPNSKKGKHASTISMEHFAKYLEHLDGMEADIMFEIKDKELSVLKALKFMEHASGKVIN